ncbi:hypothetical protein [Bifidobacterium sp. ESL0704]|uniref:hypothetical protein n=1 Tax=Bifidobacterium sp. ESL0704 TaxID=2983219 RepID=UPI0023F73A2A|nr:hypothetical protein [Bifidobacterium sp. ESL0704]WEV52843.1 hypothetical protein OZX64_08310 [Bifidobacterium sp. ESL0704]
MSDLEHWEWDDSKAVESTGEQASREAAAMLMEMTGMDNVDDAQAVMLGRPRAGQKKERTVRLQVLVPESWSKNADRQAQKHGTNRSEWLRHLLQGPLQTA